MIYSVLPRSVKGCTGTDVRSTNAERPGFTPSEKTVGKTFDTLFEEHKNTRILWRLSHPMWIVYSRSSTQPINLAVK